MRALMRIACRSTPLRQRLLLPILVCLASPGAGFADALEPLRHLVEQGQAQAAYDQLNNYVQAHPRDAQALFLLGRAAQIGNRIDPAIAAYEKLLQIRPDLPEVYNNLAVLYAARGDDKRARDYLFTALNTHPSYAVAYQNLAQLYASLASSAYSKALNTHSEDARNATPLPTLTPLDYMLDTRATPHDGGGEAIGETKRQVQEMLTAWAQAWSKADTERYLKFYAPQFVVPDGLARADWENQRRVRISGPRFIEVKFKQLDIRPLEDTTLALVNFDQLYRSDNFSDTVKKFLVVKKVGDQWFILQEITGS
ncbi:MAG: tetratricopeptide repeat protein [Pseudomonadota bacterium]